MPKLTSVSHPNVYRVVDRFVSEHSMQDFGVHDYNVTEYDELELSEIERRLSHLDSEHLDDLASTRPDIACIPRRVRRYSYETQVAMAAVRLIAHQSLLEAL